MSSIFNAILKECIKYNFNLQDPLNSGDDVSEQDTPDLFDIDNVIVCQYDKVQYTVLSLFLNHSE